MKPTPIWIYDRNEILRVVLEPKNSAVFEESAEQTTLHASMTLGVDEEPIPPRKDRAIPYRNGWYAEQLNGKVVLQFEIPNDIENADLIRPDGRAVIRDQDGNLVEFIIRKIDDTGGWKSVQAEGSDYENIDEWVTGYSATNVDLKTAATAVLQNTRWEVGIVEDFDTNVVDFVDITVKNAIHQLTELYGVERRYRVKHEGNRITKRYIDFLNRRGANTGKRFEEGKDISEYRRTVDTVGIKTALYGRGASQEDGSRLDFSSVEWVGPDQGGSDPAYKPLGQTWIGDKDALEKWGYDQGTRHRWGMYDGQEEDPGQLLLNTWRKLQTIKDSVDTYDFDVILLEELTGLQHEKVRLGDTVAGIVRSVKPSITVEASIIEYQQNLNDPKQSQVVLGAFRKYFDTNARLHDVERIVSRSRGSWDKKASNADVEGAKRYAEDASNILEGIYDVAKAPIQTADSGARITFDGTNGFVQWDENNNAVVQLDLSGNAVFKGRMISGSIESDTFINVQTDLYVGEQITLTGSAPTVTFDTGTSINLNSAGSQLEIKTPGDISLNGGSVSIANLQGSHFLVVPNAEFRGTVQFLGDTLGVNADQLGGYYAEDYARQGPNQNVTFREVNTYQVYSDAGTAGYFKYNDSNYIKVSSSGIDFYVGGALVHTIS